MNKEAEKAGERKGMKSAGRSTENFLPSLPSSHPLSSRLFFLALSPHFILIPLKFYLSLINWWINKLNWFRIKFYNFDLTVAGLRMEAEKQKEKRMNFEKWNVKGELRNIKIGKTKKTEKDKRGLRPVRPKKSASNPPPLPLVPPLSLSFIIISFLGILSTLLT